MVKYKKTPKCEKNKDFVPCTYVDGNETGYTCVLIGPKIQKSLIWEKDPNETSETEPFQCSSDFTTHFGKNATLTSSCNTTNNQIVPIKVKKDWSCEIEEGK